MKYYVVLSCFKNEHEQDIQVVGVGETPENAQQIFDNQIIKDRKTAQEFGWDIMTDEGNYFEAYKEGYYDDGHIVLYIQEVTKSV